MHFFFVVVFSDSICYLSKPGWEDLPLGPHLGDLTDQLEDDYGPQSFCTEFVSAGAKNYAYKVAVRGDVNNIKTVVKVRGISINSSCSDTLTFDNLKKLVFENEIIHVKIPSRIERVKGWRIVTKSSTKLWRSCLNKRRCIENNQTVPYGFQSAVLTQDDYNLIDDLCDEE